MKLVWTCKAQQVVPSCKVGHVSHLWCTSPPPPSTSPWKKEQKKCWSFWHTRTYDGPRMCKLSPLNSHLSHIKHAVLDLLIVKSNHTMFKLHIAHHFWNTICRLLTHLWPWNKVKVIKPDMNWKTQSKIIIMQRLKDLALRASEKRPTFFLFFKWRYISIISLEYM